MSLRSTDSRGRSCPLLFGAISRPMGRDNVPSTGKFGQSFYYFLIFLRTPSVDVGSELLCCALCYVVYVVLSSAPPAACLCMHIDRLLKPGRNWFTFIDSAAAAAASAPTTF
jgi:hypothetical protein